MIRRAEQKDIEGLIILLHQVNDLHAKRRPDLFIMGRTKYNEADLSRIIKNENTPVFVFADSDDKVLGYSFCVLQKEDGASNRRAVKNIYIDDICVDKGLRRRHIGKKLYEFVESFAREKGFHSITLNVWEINKNARLFYESCGLKPLKTTMEKIIDY